MECTEVLVFSEFSWRERWVVVGRVKTFCWSLSPLGFVLLLLLIFPYCSSIVLEVGASIASLCEVMLQKGTLWPPSPFHSLPSVGDKGFPFQQELA